MSISYGGDNITFPDASTQNTASKTGFVNRIINGAMVIDQRNAGASVTITNTGAFTYTLDRWAAFGSAASKFSVQQNAGAVTPPVGFTNYLGVTSLAATSLGAGDYYVLQQQVEGFNIADLGWGTASASPVSISFKIYSSLTGTFSGSLVNGGNNRSYPFTYTISSANTWTNITVTVPGDISGTWATNNSSGIRIYFSLGTGTTLSGTANAWQAGVFTSATGATSVVGTSGATFFVTGVQLEKGSTATPFEFRSIGQELSLAQRYFENVAVSVSAGVATNMSTTARYAVIKRATATIVRTGNWQSGGEAGTIINNNEPAQFIAYNPTTNATYAGGIFTASAEL
jgi:hypothetical protein